jgi:hypothetical protein
MYITEGLTVHFLVMGSLLAFIALQLRHHHLFHWRSAGFWAWSAIALYFFITPLIQHLDDPYYLETRLALTEGLWRMVWITVCVAVGTAVFFLAYFNTRPGHPNFGLPQETWPRGAWIVIILGLVGAAYSLGTYRGVMGLGDTAQATIQGGKFVGDTMGYTTVMHTFASIPIVLLLVRRSTRVLGLAILGFYLAGRLEDAHDRASAVSLLLAISIISTYRRKRPWPAAWLVAGAVAFTLLVHARGHQSLSSFLEEGHGGQALKISREEVGRGEGASMLASFYIKSYLHDKAGYTYGVPVVSGMLFGALPRKYFPWKDWMVEAYSHRDLADSYGSDMLYGSKSSVIGDLYGAGGMIGIFLGMPLVGFLTRKLDGFLSPQAPLAVRVLGSVWLGSYWLMFGSSLTWAFGAVYLTGIPFIALVLISRFLSPKTVRAKNLHPSLKQPGFGPVKEITHAPGSDVR